MPSLKNQSGIIPLVVLAIIGMVSASGVTVVTSQKSIPGDALYPVKKAVENVRVATAISEKDKAKVHLTIAEEKVKEIQKLEEKGRIEKIAETVQTLKNSEVKALELTQVAKSKGQNTAELTSLLQTQIGKQQAVLGRISVKVPEQARQAIQKALDQLKEAAEATKEGASASPTPTPHPTASPTIASTPCPSPSPSPSPNDINNQEEDTGNQEDEDSGYRKFEDINVLGVLFSFAGRGFGQLQNSQYGSSKNPCDSYENNSGAGSQTFDGGTGTGEFDGTSVDGSEAPADNESSPNPQPVNPMPQPSK